MSCSFVLDWKFVVALGTAVTGTILAVKLNPESAAKVMIHAVDTGRGYAGSLNNGC